MVLLDYGPELTAPAFRARTLTEIFSDIARTHPDQVALSLPSHDLSYAELDAWTDGEADRLRAAGAGPGEYVGVRVTSGTAELYAAILAVLKSGAAYVPVDAEDPEERIRSVFEAADVLGVLGDGLAFEPRRASRAQRRTPRPDDDAWVIFTSGTTGTPKGVAITHRSAVAFVHAEHRLWQIGTQDRVLAGLSVSFDASCEEIWSAWSTGATLVPVPRSVVRAGVEMGPWIRDRAITVVSTVPTLAALWDDEVLAGLRLVILGGEALPEPLGHRLARECEVWNTYGPTEATVVSTASRVWPGMPISIGYPLDGWLTALVDEDGREVSPGDPGELVIGGVGLGRYLDPELDRQRYVAMPSLGWARGYRSGDIARETSSGYEFVGRRDDQVKIGGRRIELGEVDAHLASCEGVLAAAASVRETGNGNKVLVGYVVAAEGAVLDPAIIRDTVAARMSGGVTPLVIELDALPQKSSGKVDRARLPWPPPAADEDAGGLTGTAAWLRDLWRDELGPLPMAGGSNFFHLGGGSLSAARLVNGLRRRFPTVAISDIYQHPTIAEFADHLDALSTEIEVRTPRPLNNSRRHLNALAQLVGVALVLTVGAIPWITGVLIYDRITGDRGLPTMSWWALVPIWFVTGSLPGRALIVASLRRLLLSNVRPGRYHRHSWLSWRLWFVDTLAGVFHVNHLAGTPWAGRIARFAGFTIHPTAHLETMPPPSAQLSIGAGATVEKEVELRGWVMEGLELVVAPILIEDRARVAQRAMLSPGVRIGRGAEVEPGTVVISDIADGERWGGSPAVRLGNAGDEWPVREPQPTRRPATAAFGIALAFRELVPLISMIGPMVWIAFTLGGSAGYDLQRLLLAAPVLGAAYVVVHALVLAGAIRLVGRRFGAGWHRNDSGEAAALWLCEALMADAMSSLFPLFSSSFTRPWLRLCGIRLGRGTEVSTATGLSHLVSLGELCFSTDGVGFATARSRDGWTELRTITVGDRTFLGNTSIVLGGTHIGDDCLIGLQTVAPRSAPDGTTWFGTPAIEFPRTQVAADATRTLFPTGRIRALRRGFDLLRIGVPVLAMGYLASAAYGALIIDAHAYGLASLLIAGPVVALAAGLLACALTIVLKWTLIGRYKTGSHPFFSAFVWRDEVINSCQVMLAGPWLLSSALGTPVMNLYLRLMGADVGRDAYVATLWITEFDQVHIGESAALNTGSCIQTHLFSDRVMQIGPNTLGAGSSVGPHSAVLLDTCVGADTHIAMGSVLMRGEELPAATRWLGIPLVMQG